MKAPRLTAAVLLLSAVICVLIGGTLYIPVLPDAALNNLPSSLCISLGGLFFIGSVAVLYFGHFRRR